MTAQQRFDRDVNNAMLHYHLGNPRAIQAIVRSQYTDRAQQKFVQAFRAAGVPDAVIFGTD